ncbi:MAG: TonB-dependent receptor, partial [Marinilabiliaceae bacterium]
MAPLSRTTYIITILLIFSINSNAQRKINGYILDAKTGESLPGAHITADQGRGTTSNQYGYFALKVARETERIKISHIGFTSREIDISKVKDSLLFIRLTPGYVINDVKIEGHSSQPYISGNQSGKLQLNQKDFNKAGPVLGEPDMIKSLQSLPGLSQGKEGSSELYVRGGGTGENKIMLDGTPVYNINHALGLLSMFNADALKETTVYKGGIPARFGGRLSSVIDVLAREGNDQNIEGSFFISTIGAGLIAEGPIKKEKSSWILSARRSWPDLLVTGAMSAINSESFVPGISFHDINAKTSFQLNNNDHLFLSFYTGGDQFFIKSESQNINSKIHTGWGNKLASAGYTSVISPTVFGHFKIHYSSYFDKENHEFSTRENSNSFKRESLFREISGKSIFDLQYSNNLMFKTGIKSTFRWFEPATIHSKSHGTLNEKSAPARRMSNISVFGESIWTPGPWRINSGLRVETDMDGQSVETTLLPRVSASYRLNKTISLKGSGMFTKQSFFPISRQAMGWPGYFYVPLTDNLKKARGYSLSSGINITPTRNWNIDIEAYYKTTKNIPAAYEIPTSAYAQTNWQLNMATGKNRSKGIELLSEYKSTIFDVRMAYTLARSEVKFEKYHEGEYFPADFDRRHDLNLNLSFNLNREKQRTLSANFFFRSGTPYTLSSAEAQAMHPPLLGDAFWHDFSFS